MHYFWKTVTWPLLQTIRPRTIAEIGCADGKHTKCLLEYCRLYDARLTAIDPAPSFNEPELKRVYGDKLKVIRDLSLRALPELGAIDAVMLDGDHNWYTVYHELKHLERMKRFPIVFLHDTEWPYSRRDMYYFPNSIPDAFRHPSAQRGIVRGRLDLVPGGFNEKAHNAVREFGQRNGVLTAIEDFLAETQVNIRFHRVAAQYGLGILIPNDRAAGVYYNETVARVIAQSGLKPG